MPDVPNLPGVPPLTSFAPANVALITADVVTVIGAFLTPPWGIYQNGAPIITPPTVLTQAFSDVLSLASLAGSLLGLNNLIPVSASMVEFDFTADSPISNYPQQNGGFQSYDKVQLPFDIKVKLACSGTPAMRQAFENTLEKLRTGIELVDIVTPERVFVGVNCKHVDFHRTATNGVQLIVADVWFEEVRETSTTEFTSTKSPTDAAPQSLGNVQPQTPSPSVSALVGASGTVN